MAQCAPDRWVRLDYLPTPGPAGTAVRVAGLMYDGFLIEVEAIAVVGCGELRYTEIP
jgi:enamine deaminase RidA (YjgF/YER057c/UK114 family)